VHRLCEPPDNRVRDEKTRIGLMRAISSPVLKEN